MTEPLNDTRLRELHELAWNPEYLPPAEMTALRYRHELLRDAVREIDRVRERVPGFNQVRALFEILGEHRIMYPTPPMGESPKLVADLMEWAFVAAACEVQDVTAERDEALARLSELGDSKVEWGIDHGSLGVLDASVNEAAIREQAARRGREIRRRIVGEWLLEDGSRPPPVCDRCHGSRKVPDWSNWNHEYGEPRPKPCPDCAVRPDAADFSQQRPELPQ